MEPLTIAALAGAAYLFTRPSKQSPKSVGTPAEGRNQGAALLTRAAQGASWVPDFVKAGASTPLAEALGRWAGIESGGNPLAESSIKERGLLQMGPHAVKEGYLTQTEWDALKSIATPRAMHAAIALKLFGKFWDKARRYVKNPPASDIDKVWYAKMYHQRPQFLASAQSHGPARLMAGTLANRWAKAGPMGLHNRYLRAANVVAFNDPNPAMVTT
jgi:hypothetical protein